MVQPPEIERIVTESDVDTTAHTIDQIPRGLWTYYKSIAQADVRYTRIPDKVIRYFAIEVACNRRHGKDVEDVLLEHDLLTEEEINNALELDPP